MKARWPFLLALCLFCVAGLRDRFDAWVDATELPVLLAETSVEVLGRDGALLRAYAVENGRWRLSALPDAVDDGYVAMLLAYEDKRFWSHNGIDPHAMTRALAQAVWHGSVVSGGSTLTMQVARLLENSGTGRVSGKLRQMRLALALERKLSKEDILKLYLLHAPFGGNLEGVRAASLAYFGKEPKRLSTAEAALLVALPQSPETRRPDIDPKAARLARATVLERMVSAGHLSRVEADRALAAKLPETRRRFPLTAAHLADRARRENPVAKVHRLTIDTALQRNLETLVADRMAQAGRGLSAALMVVDHRSGEVLASIGSTGLDGPNGHVDMTRAPRSPGSTLKPLVYALAYDTGKAHPLSLITDAPVRFGTYAPVNFDGQYRGDVTLDYALQASLNTPVVQLTEMITPARLVASMRAAGMMPELQGPAPGLAVALGGVGARLEDLVALYAGLAQGGQRRAVLWRADGAQDEPSSIRFVSEKSAWQVSRALSQLAPPLGMPRDRLAYKTGTSYGHRDAWAIGFDGAHVIGVWIGRPDGTSVPGIFGADLAAPLLFEAAQRVSDQAVPLPLAPDGVAAWRAADLPEHLRHIGTHKRDTSARRAHRFSVSFPPEGAELVQPKTVIKLDNGAPPFTVFLNGTPVAKRTRARAIPLLLDGPGFHKVTVVDAKGQSDRVEISLR